MTKPNPVFLFPDQPRNLKIYNPCQSKVAGVVHCLNRKQNDLFAKIISRSFSPNKSLRIVLKMQNLPSQRFATPNQNRGYQTDERLAQVCLCQVLEVEVVVFWQFGKKKSLILGMNYHGKRVLGQLDCGRLSLEAKPVGIEYRSGWLDHAPECQRLQVWRETLVGRSGWCSDCLSKQLGVGPEPRWRCPAQQQQRSG